MAVSKPWDWDRNELDIWHDPSEDSFYLLERWKSMGFSRFLDLGCGMGRHSLQFARAGFDVFALDLSEKAVDYVGLRAREEGLSLSVSSGDMTDLPYASGQMDCLLAFHVLSHTDTPGMKRVVSEMERVVRPGGEIYVTLCSKDTWSFKEAGFPVIDENTVMKVEDGPEDGIPHFFADREIIDELFSGFHIHNLRHVQELVVRGSEYVSWHYFLHAVRVQARGSSR